MAILKQGVVSDKGFLLLTGGVGTGKTTLINVIAKSLDIPGYICMISNPTLGSDDFFFYFAAQLGLLFDGNKAKFFVLFSKLLEECKKSRRKVLLIIDEAHALPTDLLEEMRLLVNMAVEVKNVLSIFLVGQPELLERLAEKQLSPISQRIAVRYHLDQLSKADALQYVLFRLKRAGAGKYKIFSEEALGLIYEATRGNPRQINTLCDNALFAAYSKERLAVDEKVIRECIEKLYILGDDSTFCLPTRKTLWQNWMVRSVLGIVLLEGAAAVYALHRGWLQPIYQYLKRFLNIG
ncbi:MAG: AAA family ATPase [Pseudomonadota bacterium]